MKLSDIGEEILALLEEEDDADIWRDREVYRRRIAALQASLIRVSAIKAMRHFGVPEPESLLTPRKHGWGGARRKAGQAIDPLELGLDIAVDDVRRIRDILGGRQSAPNLAELIAAERHLRIMYDTDGDGEKWEAERHELIEKLLRRQRGSGTSGADRRRAR
jgi:hypothetical protein